MRTNRYNRDSDYSDTEVHNHPRRVPERNSRRFLCVCLQVDLVTDGPTTSGSSTVQVKFGAHRVVCCIQFYTIESARLIGREDGVTYSRCGTSENRPFCDGTHEQIGFSTEANGASPGVRHGTVFTDTRTLVPSPLRGGRRCDSGTTSRRGCQRRNRR